MAGEITISGHDISVSAGTPVTLQCRTPKLPPGLTRTVRMNATGTLSTLTSPIDDGLGYVVYSFTENAGLNSIYQCLIYIATVNFDAYSLIVSPNVTGKMICIKKVTDLDRDSPSG